jgi:D-aminopeptidase
MMVSLTVLSWQLESMVANRQRARHLGLQFGSLPTGRQNAITDVAGVLVGHVTLNNGEGELVPGQGPVRTGVTAILPHPGNLFADKVEGAVHVINGFGKSAGLLQVEELGQIESPILLTNTLSVGAVLEGAVRSAVLQSPEIGVTTGTVNCIVGECNDGFLNDIQGMHVRPGHAQEAIARACSDQPAEGAVGAGTGMVCYGFKGGIGTASRLVSHPELASPYTLGALVLTNFGKREHLTLCGVPVGRMLVTDDEGVDPGDGSVMIILATDAPLDSRQLGRLAKRGAFGLARSGSIASNGSGDFVIAFSTTRRHRHDNRPLLVLRPSLGEDGALLSEMFQAVAEAVDEAVANSLFMAVDTTGRDGNTALSLPVEKTRNLFKKVIM